MKDAALVSQAEVNGRLYEVVPRLKQSVDEMMGVAYFHGTDNPFGNPMGVWNLWKNGGPDIVKERLYGIAFRQIGACFRRFSRKVHVLPDDQIPKRGVVRHIVDPSKGRNYAQLWIRQTRDGRHYVFHEFPNQHEYIEGVGVMEPWAIPDGKKLDGRRGGGADPLGWGLMDYLAYWAGFEGWPEDWPQRVQQFRGLHEEVDRSKMSKIDRLFGQQGPLVDQTDQGAKLRVAQRIIDSRAASEGKVQVESMRYTTLQSEFDELGVWFDLAPGSQIATGRNLIINGLAYNPDQKLSFENSPDLYFAESCKNTIFAMETWTGEDGNKGACKDWIDLLRYYLESKPEWEAELETWGAPRMAPVRSPY